MRTWSSPHEQVPIVELHNWWRHPVFVPSCHTVKIVASPLIQSFLQQIAQQHCCLFIVASPSIQSFTQQMAEIEVQLWGKVVDIMKGNRDRFIFYLLPCLHQVWYPGLYEVYVNTLYPSCYPSSQDLFTSIEKANPAHSFLFGTTTVVCDSKLNYWKKQIIDMYLEGKEFVNGTPKPIADIYAHHYHAPLAANYSGPIPILTPSRKNHQCDNFLFDDAGGLNCMAVSLETLAQHSLFINNSAVKVLDIRGASEFGCEDMPDGIHYVRGLPLRRQLMLLLRGMQSTPRSPVLRHNSNPTNSTMWSIVQNDTVTKTTMATAARDEVVLLGTQCNTSTTTSMRWCLLKDGRCMPGCLLWHAFFNNCMVIRRFTIVIAGLLKRPKHPPLLWGSAVVFLISYSLPSYSSRRIISRSQWHCIWYLVLRSPVDIHGVSHIHHFGYNLCYLCSSIFTLDVSIGVSIKVKHRWYCWLWPWFCLSSSGILPVSIAKVVYLPSVVNAFDFWCEVARHTSVLPAAQLPGTSNRYSSTRFETDARTHPYAQTHLANDKFIRTNETRIIRPHVQTRKRRHKFHMSHTNKFIRTNERIRIHKHHMTYDRYTIHKHFGPELP